MKTEDDHLVDAIDEALTRPLCPKCKGTLDTSTANRQYDFHCPRCKIFWQVQKKRRSS
jgi:tRNA(Ile2) C34 agmatinyltransferase TiaS